MYNMTLNDIIKASDGEYFGPESKLSIEIHGIDIDSRKISKNFLFIPIKGERVDGHDFILKTFENGAIASLSEKKLSKEYEPYILVKSTLQSIKDIAEYYRKSLDIKVIGVTGSVGKTTTKEIIYAVLQEKYSVLKTEGNFNNEIGLPLTIFKIKKEHEVAVLEMGISDFGEMHRLSKIARPDICVITNIGDCHLENLKDLEGVLRAKTEIFDYMEADGIIILNGDDKSLSSVEEKDGIRPIFFGLNNKNQIFADAIKDFGLKGMSFAININKKNINIEIDSPGQYMIYNALAAAGVGKVLGLSDKEIKDGIESFENVSGRSKIIKTNYLTIIDDCYNANPMSMKASLDTLSKSESRKVCILGDMLELGESTINYHKEIGEYAALVNIDVIICAGELSAYIYEGANKVKNKSETYYFETKEKLINSMFDLIKSNDTVLVKASRGMHFEGIVDVLSK